LVIERRLALGLVGKRADHHHAAIAWQDSAAAFLDCFT
jgi:hypothetical protein